MKVKSCKQWKVNLQNTFSIHLTLGASWFCYENIWCVFIKTFKQLQVCHLKMNNLIHNRDLIWKENSNKSSIPPGYFDKCNKRSCSWQSLQVISWPVTIILTIGLELASTKLSNKNSVFDPWGDTYELLLLIWIINYALTVLWF